MWNALSPDIKLGVNVNVFKKMLNYVLHIMYFILL